MIAAALFLAAAFTRPMERVATLDPVFAQSVYDSRVVQLLYETPLNIDYYARPYTLSPGYCELPEVSEDGLVYTFRTRGGSAADMVASLARLRDPEIVTPNGWLMKSVDTITAKDDRTVEIRLKNRCHFFPWLMAMSPASVRRPDGSGTGPFELASWRKNHEMVFRRRSPSPKQFDTVRYLVIDDLSTQWLMFLKGEIDFLGEISKDNWDVVMGKDGNLDPSLAAQGVKLYSIPTLEVFYMGVNMRDPVLGGNKKLRQALNAAFDYPRWEEYFSKRTVQADGPVPPGVDGKLSAPFKYAFDLDLAKRLMKEAGYADGIDPKTGRRLVLTLTNQPYLTDGAAQGAAATMNAFAQGLPFLPAALTNGLLTVSLVLFGFTTILGWNYYSERCLEYLTGGRQGVVLGFRWLYIAAVFIGPYMTVSAVWGIADIFNGLMAIPNMIALLALSGVVAAETKRYFDAIEKEKDRTS